MSKARDIRQELRMVLRGRSNLVDSLLPHVLYLLFNPLWGLQVASVSALALSVLVAVYRPLRHQPPRYALAGAGGVAVAALLAYLLGRAEGFFLSSIGTGVFGVLLCLVSVLVGRPLLAFCEPYRRPLDSGLVLAPEGSPSA